MTMQRRDNPANGGDTTAFGTAVADVRHAVAGTLRQYGRDRLELEFRLGRQLRGTFVPGVSEAGWQRLRSTLDRCTKMKRHYTETREFISANAEKFVQPVEPEGTGAWMFKKRLHNLDVDMGVLGCCRASISLEESGGPSGGPSGSQASRPTHHTPPPDAKFVRHKRRWSYRYKCWSVDVTSVNSNLPHQLDDDRVSHEVELELVDTTVLFSMPLETLIEWGLRLARDMATLATHPRDTKHPRHTKQNDTTTLGVLLAPR